MTVADSPKKRKRVFSRSPERRGPVPTLEPKFVDMATDFSAMRAIFDKALEDTREINKYSEKHAKLLRSEHESAWDRAARLQYDPDEQQAANIIREMREYERRVVFGNQASEAIPAKTTRDMGGQFLTNKDRIDHESLLFQIARKVPKGGLLHVHFNAELHPERLLVRARSIRNIYIRSIRPLQSQKDLEETEMVFNVLDSDQVEKGVSIFDPTYPGNATNWKTPEWMWKVWMPWSTFQEEFKKKFPGQFLHQRKENVPAGSTCCSEPSEPGSEVELTPAENWLKSKMVLSEEEAYGFTQTVNG